MGARTMPVSGGRRKALVLVDLQKEFFVNPGFAAVRALAERKQLLENVRRALWTARNKRIPVFFLQVLRRPDYGDFPRAEDGPFKEGTEGAELLDGLVRAEDFVIPKRRRSGFFGTPLEIYLRAMGVTEVVIGGISTEVGVESTVRDAWDRDFEVKVLSDCCATSDSEIDEFVIKRILPAWAQVLTSNDPWDE